MKYLSSNIKHLRKKKKLTQDELALKIGVKRSLIGSYEEGRAFPKLSLIQEMALYFDISFEDMLNLDLSNETTLNKNNKDITGNNIRVLSTIVDKKNKEEFEKTLKGVDFGLIGCFASDNVFRVYGLDGRVCVETDARKLKESWQKPLKW